MALFVAPGDPDGTPIFNGVECGLGANDYILVIECIELETVCAPGSGPCDEPNGTPGCDDPDCCVLVCDADPLCCLSIGEWDQTCVNTAEQLCGGGGGCEACGGPTCGDCFVSNGSPYCDDAACCEIVCALDPYCCDVTWDGACAGEAVEFCVCEKGDVPANDECVNAIAIGLGDTRMTNSCATPGGPDHASCNDGFVTGLGADVWFAYTAEVTSLLTITPVVDPIEEWTTQIAIYEGCACDLISDPPYGCADLGGSVTVPVAKGVCYLIRVGGTFGDPSGVGTLTLTSSDLPEVCVGGIGDCLQANGSPGCDQPGCCFNVCQADPDCCDVDWDQACADLAAATCSPLPCVLDTSAANVIEPEACGDDTNAGCNNVPTDTTDVDPSMFTQIVSGDVIAGTAWADGGARDTDWYRINVTAEDDADGDGMVDIHYNIRGELPVVSFLIVDESNNCQDVDTGQGTTAYSQSCAQVDSGVGTVAAPGEYYIFAGTGNAGGGAIFDGYPCPAPGAGVIGNQYLLCITVVDDGQPAVTDCPPAGNPCPADLVVDGVVGVKDLLFLLGTWGPCPKKGDCPADLVVDGVVGVKDLLFLLGAWGPCP